MTPEQIEQERAAFEAWYCEYHQIPEHHRAMFTNRLSPCEERYEGTAGHTAWHAWLTRAEQSGWISVADRLPKEDDHYLIFTPKGNIVVARFYPGMDAWWRYSETMHPTHWQPLPPPPVQAT